jgi:hypothetical protein
MAERLTYEAARKMGHWFWLTQSSTIPEQLIELVPYMYVRHIIEQWDGADVIDDDAVDKYVRRMRNPEILRTMGADYRADQLDLEHDRTDRMTACRIGCPALAVWAQGGVNGVTHAFHTRLQWIYQEGAEVACRGKTDDVNAVWNSGSSAGKPPTVASRREG